MQREGNFGRIIYPV